MNRLLRRAFDRGVRSATTFVQPTRDMLAVLAVPTLFAITFNFVPLAAAQAAAVLSDLAPRPIFDGVFDPAAIYAAPVPWGTFRWEAALALIAATQIFVLTLGALALGLHQFRAEQRGVMPSARGRIIAWTGCALLPAATMAHLLLRARASGSWPSADPFTVTVLALAAATALDWWLFGRVRVSFRTGLIVFLIAIPLLVALLGTANGTLLVAAPGSEFQLLDTLGPMVVLLVGLSALALGIGLIVGAARRRRVPVFAGLALWIVLLALFDLNDNHPVRLQPGPSSANETQAKRDDDSLAINGGEWETILAPWKHDTLLNGDRRPIVLVSAEGGGIRAAYFTAATLGRIADKCPRIAREMLAVSGISGGALGVAAYAMAVRGHPIAADDQRCDFAAPGRGYYEAHLSRLFRRDLLSPVVARALFPDLAQRALPFPIDAFDRQLGLELALRKAFAQEFGADSFAAAMGQPDGQHVTPLIIVGATSVATGNQLLFSEYDQVVGPGGRQRGFNLASAVASSARFPLISPPGYFYGSLGETRGGRPVAHKIQVVDGGYYDNSGAFALTQVLDRINYYRRHDNMGFPTDDPALDSATPVLWIRIQNAPTCITGYANRYLDRLCATQTKINQHPSYGLAELLSPLKAIAAARNAKERITVLAMIQQLDARNEIDKSRDAEIDVQMAPIEDDIPLGWYLSERSANSLSWQLSTKRRSTCSLNGDDATLASCALERLQYLVSPQTADVRRIDNFLTDFVSGYDGMQHDSCEYALRDNPRRAQLIAACETQDRFPTNYCLATPLHPSACNRPAGTK